MSRRGSSLALPIIPEGKQPITYEQSSGRTYVVQHLRGNAVVVRRTSSNGMQEGRRTSLASQPWERRASATPSSPSQPSSSDWAQAANSMPIRRGSAQMSPIQMLPPNTLSTSSPSRRPSFQQSFQPYPSKRTSSSSICESTISEEDAEMMDVDAMTPCSSAFASPASSPPTSPGLASPMSIQRPQASGSPLKTKLSNWLRHV